MESTTIYVRLIHPDGLVRTYERPLEQVRERIMQLEGKNSPLTEESSPFDVDCAVHRLGRDEFDLVFSNPVGRIYCKDAILESGVSDDGEDELADWDNQKSTARCDPEILSEGTNVCVTDLPSKEAERWVREIRRYSGQKVDWGYVGGRVVVKALGDLGKVVVAMRNRSFMHDPWKRGIVYVDEPAGLKAKPKSETGDAAREAAANPSNPIPDEQFQELVERANRKKLRRPTTPGEMLEEEFLKPAGISREAFIEHIGYHPPDIHGVIDEGDRIDGRLARTIAEATNTTAQFWLNMQHAVDEYEAMREDLPLPECLDAFADRETRG